MSAPTLHEFGVMHRYALDEPRIHGAAFSTQAPRTITLTEKESTMPTSTRPTTMANNSDDKDKESSGDDYGKPHTDIV